MAGAGAPNPRRTSSQRIVSPRSADKEFDVEGRIFQYLLVTVTVLPFFIFLLPESILVLGVIFVLATFAGAHVPSTAYLFFSRDIITGVPHWKWTIVAIPIVLMTSVYIFLFLMPIWATVAFFLVYIHFGIWHFGRQNLGVLNFSLRIGSSRSMDLFERRTIVAGVIAGICAAYTFFGPSLVLHPELFPVPVSPVAPVFAHLWYVGAAIYAVLIPVVLHHVWKERRAYDLPSLVLYLSSVLFFLSLFVTANPMFSGNWAIAHGAQYELFVVFHAKSRMRATLAGLIPGVVLLVVAVAGKFLWTTYPSWSPSWLAHAGGAAVIAITLAHYWVDMFLWRFQTPERRAWLYRHYSFLAGSTAPAGRLVPIAGD
jgi:hypothetical protein